MIKYYLVFFLSLSIAHAQEMNNEWLDTILDKKVAIKKQEEVDEEKDKNNIYFTIQVAAKATFADAEEVVKILNN